MDTPKIIYDGKTTPDDMRALLDLYQLELSRLEISIRSKRTAALCSTLAYDRRRPI